MAVAVASAAGGGLSLVLSNLDLSAYPQVSVAMQMGGEQAVALGDVTKEEISVKVDGNAGPGRLAQDRREQGVALPVQTVLLIDESGSMKGEAITAASAAATTFIDAMKPDDTAAVESFNDAFRTLQSFSGDTGCPQGLARLPEPHRRRRLSTTPLLKARRVVPARQRESRPGTSSFSPTAATPPARPPSHQAVAAVRASGIPVYAMGLKSKEFDSAPLQSIADASGGRYVETPDPAALTSIYQTLAKELHNQYLLTFTVPQSSPSAGVGKLSVQVTGAGTAAVAEQGFFYPAAQTTTTIAGATTTTTAGPDGATNGQTSVSRFLSWSGSPYIIGVVVFLLVIAVLYILSGAIFPQRSVLSEYDGLIDRKNISGPQALGEESEKQSSAVTKAATRLLAVRGYQHPLQRLIDDAALKFRASEFVVLQLIALVVLLVIAAVARSSRCSGSSSWRWCSSSCRCCGSSPKGMLGARPSTIRCPTP